MIYKVTEYLERNARLMPEKIAVSDRSGSYTWRELKDRARRIATSLLSEGTERGIMVYGDKSFDVPVSYTHLDVYKRQLPTNRTKMA